MKTLPTLLLSLALLPAALPLRAQAPLSAQFLMKNREVWNVLIRPRNPGTTTVQATRTDREGLLTVNLADVQRIHFDLSAIKPDAVAQLYYLGRHDDVINALKGKVNPYFAFVDQDANSNEMVSLFMRSLYLTGNHAGVKVAAAEVNKYAISGPVRRLSDLLQALSLLHSGNMAEMEKHKELFREPEVGDPLASLVWYGQAKMALATNNWNDAHPPLAKIITETPLDTEWVGEALYLTAEHHHSVTNLVVAHQICREIAIVAPVGPWAGKADTLREQVEKQAAELSINLEELAQTRKRKGDAGEAKIDYRERQRKLEEEAAAALKELNPAP